MPLTVIFKNLRPFTHYELGAKTLEIDTRIFFDSFEIWILILAQSKLFALCGIFSKKVYANLLYLGECVFMHHLIKDTIDYSFVIFFTG